MLSGMSTSLTEILIWRAVQGFFGSALLPLGIQIYDPATSRWTLGPALPVPIHHTHVAAVGGRIYVLGGEVEGASTGRPERSSASARSAESCCGSPRSDRELLFFMKISSSGENATSDCCGLVDEHGYVSNPGKSVPSFSSQLYVRRLDEAYLVMKFERILTNIASNA